MTGPSCDSGRQPMGTRSRNLLLWLAGMLVAGWWLQQHLVIGNDLRQFLPRQSPHGDSRAWLNLLSRNANAGLVLLVVEAGDRKATIRLSRQLRRQLQASGEFASVQNGELAWDTAAVAPLFAARYLLSPGVRPEAFTVAGLRRALEDRLADLRAGLGPLLRDSLAADPHNFFLDYLETALGGAPPKRIGGVWLDHEQRRALLVLQIAGTHIDSERQRQAVAALRNRLQSLAADAGFTWQITGPAVFAANVRMAVERTSLQVSLVTGVFLLILVAGVFRRVLWGWLVLVPLGSAILAGLVVTQAVFGQVHGITLAYGITTLGVCIDYPFHLFSHLRAGETGTRCMARIWPTLRLGSLTTAAAYLVLLGTGFAGLSQMALFSATGMLVAALVTRQVVAPLVAAGAPVRGEALARGLIRWLQGLPARPVQGGLMLLLVIGGVLLMPGRDFWADDIAALSPVSPADRRTFARLSQDAGLPDLSHVFVWHGDDPQALLVASEDLDAQLESWRGQGVIGGYLSPSRMLPSQARQAARQAWLPDRPTLEARLAQAQAGLPFRHGFFTPFIEDVAASRTRPPVTLADFRGTPLAPALESRLFREDQDWFAVTRLVNVREPAVIRDWARTHPDAGQTYVNLRQAVSTLLAAFREQALQRLAWGALVVAIIVLLQLRSFREMLRRVLPIGLGLWLTVEILWMLDVKLQMFHLLALVLVAGLGLDYSLFLGRAHPREHAAWADLHGVLIGALTTVMAFGILGLSGIPVLRALGVTVAVGTMACLSMCLLFILPGSPVGQSRNASSD